VDRLEKAVMRMVTLIWEYKELNQAWMLDEALRIGREVYPEKYIYTDHIDQYIKGDIRI
jgi:hypothetical protein